jgi:hypothetical protein
VVNDLAGRSTDVEVYPCRRVDKRGDLDGVADSTGDRDLRTRVVEVAQECTEGDHGRLSAPSDRLSSYVRDGFPHGIGGDRD